jgi:hypothetical protein
VSLSSAVKRPLFLVDSGALPVLADASNATALGFYEGLGGYAEPSVMFSFDVTE